MILRDRLASALRMTAGALVLAAGLVGVSAAPAAAHGWGHVGWGWHGWGWAPGVGIGIAPAFYPPAYYAPPVYAYPYGPRVYYAPRPYVVRPRAYVYGW